MISSHVQLLCVKKRPLVAAKYPLKVAEYSRPIVIFNETLLFQL